MHGEPVLTFSPCKMMSSWTHLTHMMQGFNAIIVYDALHYVTSWHYVTSHPTHSSMNCIMNQATCLLSIMHYLFNSLCCEHHTPGATHLCCVLFQFFARAHLLHIPDRCACRLSEKCLTVSSYSTDLKPHEDTHGHIHNHILSLWYAAVSLHFGWDGQNRSVKFAYPLAPSESNCTIQLQFGDLMLSQHLWSGMVD